MLGAERVAGKHDLEVSAQRPAHQHVSQFYHSLCHACCCTPSSFPGSDAEQQRAKRRRVEGGGSDEDEEDDEQEECTGGLLMLSLPPLLPAWGGGNQFTRPTLQAHPPAPPPDPQTPPGCGTARCAACCAWLAPTTRTCLRHSTPTWRSRCRWVGGVAVLCVHALCACLLCVEPRARPVHVCSMHSTLHCTCSSH